MGTVDVKEVTDVLETEFVAEVAHQERRNLNMLKARTVEGRTYRRFGEPR